MTEKDVEIQELLREKAMLESKITQLEQIVKSQQTQIDYQRRTIDFFMSVDDGGAQR